MTASTLFNVILADPPWLYQKNPGAKTPGGQIPGAGIAEREYPTMTNEELQALPIKNLAAPDSHLFMWVTNPGMFGGRFSRITPRDIAESWGFEYRTLLTWVKTTTQGRPTEGGMGWYFRGATEHVLYATRGKAGIASSRRESNLIMAPRTRHSVKPDELQERIERVIDGPYLELFARRVRPGWHAWGNQIDSSVAHLPAATYDPTAAKQVPGQVDIFGGAA